MFVKYKDIDDDSNVSMYEIGSDYISIIFNSAQRIYTYTYRSAGVHHVERMKVLAKTGDGLNAYVNKYCRNLYHK